MGRLLLLLPHKIFILLKIKLTKEGANNEHSLKINYMLFSIISDFIPLRYPAAVAAMKNAEKTTQP